MKVRVIQGNITEFDGDAIVNAANPALLGGGGVDGAIHRAAGPGLRAECQDIPEQSPGVRCRVGEVFTTRGYDLPAKHVIHTVGPVFHTVVQRNPRPGEVTPKDPGAVLQGTFIACLEEAERQGFKTVAFPAISCGVYGCPIDAGAFYAARSIQSRNWNLDEVTFVLFQDFEYDAFREMFREAGLIKG